MKANSLFPLLVLALTFALADLSAFSLNERKEESLQKEQSLEELRAELQRAEIRERQLRHDADRLEHSHFSQSRYKRRAAEKERRKIHRIQSLIREEEERQGLKEAS